MAERKVKVLITGDASDLDAAFKKAGTTADEFRAKAERLNQLKLDAKVLKVDSNIASVEKEIAALDGTGGKLKGTLQGLAQQFLPTNAAVDTLGSTAGASVASVGLLAGGITALAVGAKASITAFTDQATAVSKFATITGTTAQEASDLVNALDDVGISADTASAVFAKFGKNLDTKALNAYNIEIARNADGTTNMVQSFDNVIKKLENTRDVTERNKIAAAAFGKSWTELTPILERGSAAFEKSLEANKGLRLTDADLKANRDFKAAMDQLADSFKQIEITAGRAAVNGLTPFVDKIGKLSQALANIPKPPSWLMNGALGSLAATVPGAGLFMGGGGSSGGTDTATEYEKWRDKIAGTREYQKAWASANATLQASVGFTSALGTATDSLKEEQKSATEVLLDRMKAEDRAAAAAKAIGDARQRLADDDRNALEAVADAEQKVIDTRAKGIDLAAKVLDAQKNLNQARKDSYQAARDEAQALKDFQIVATGTRDRTKEVISAEKDLDSARKTAKATTQTIADLEREIADARNDVTQSGTFKVDEAQRNLTRSTLRVADANDAVKAAEKKLADLRNQNASPEDIARAQRDLESAYLDVADATSNVARAQANLNNVREAAAADPTGTKKLEDDLATTRETLAGQTQTVFDKEKALNQKRYGYAADTDEYKNAERRYYEAKETTAKKTEAVAKAEDALNTARSNQLQLPKDIAKAEDDLQKVRHNNALKHAADIDAINKALRDQQELILGNSIAMGSATGRVINSAGGVGDKPYNPPAPSIGSTAPSRTSNSTRASNINAIVRAGRAKGLTDEQIIGLVANAQAESGLSNTAAGDGGHSIGLFQLNDNGGAGVGVTVAQRQDPNVNVAKILADGGLSKAIGAASAEAFAAAFARYVERPADKDGEARKRAALATQLRNDPELLAALGKSTDTTVQAKDIGRTATAMELVARNSEIADRQIRADNARAIRNADDNTNDTITAIFDSGTRMGEAARNGSAQVVAALGAVGQTVEAALAEAMAKVGTAGAATPAYDRGATESLADYEARKKREADAANPPEVGSPGPGWYWDGSAWVKYNSETGAYDRVEDPGKYAKEHPNMTRAGGGMVAAGKPYVVGERGPEMFVPGSGGTIIPNGAGGTVVNLTVHGTVVSERDLVSVVNQGLQEAWRRSGVLTSAGTLTLRP